MDTRRGNGKIAIVNIQAANLTEDLASERPFRLLTIFDSEESNLEAASASRRVLQELGEDVPVHKNSWDVRELGSPALRDQAAEQAAHADVILIDLTSREPSDPLRQWLGQWQTNRSVNCGLLALIPTGEQENTRALESFCNDAAVSANMDFLCRD